MRGAECAPAKRDGMVLLFALLCLIAIEVTAVGVHFIALQELRAAQAAARGTQLRLSAQAAASRALVQWPAPGLEALAVMDSMPLPDAAGAADHGITFSATVARLAGDLYLVRGVARSPLREMAATGALVALAPADDIAAAVPAALTASGRVTMRAGGTASAVSACPGSGAPGDAAVLVASSDALDVIGGSVSGPIRIATGDLPVARIGVLTRSMLERGAGQHVGDLALNGAQSGGILIVDGSLNLEGARFEGIIMVRGSAHLGSASVVNGALIVDGDVLIEAGAQVALNRCAVADALRDIRVRGPFRPVGRMWIPLF